MTRRLTGICALLAALTTAAWLPTSVDARPAGAAVTPSAIRTGPARTPVLRSLVRGLVAAGAPGAIAVLRTPRTVRRGAWGFASLEPRTAVRATARWRVASVTKTFVATVVLELAGEGKLGLDDTLEHWLPGLVPGGGAITIRELLDHTSGLFNYTADDAFDQVIIDDPGREWGPRELVAVGVGHQPVFGPGAGWGYSNTNYVLLGLIVEAATGTALEQQLRQRLFAPLSLTATSFPTGTETEGPFVHGYIGTATLPLARGTLVDITSRLSPSWLWAAGAMVSNGDDLTRFYAALLGGHVLRPDLLTAMRTFVPYYNYGLGLWRFGTPCGYAYGHIGDFLGWRTVVYGRSNGRRVAVVMVNVDKTHVTWARLEAAAAKALCSG